MDKYIPGFVHAFSDVQLQHCSEGDKTVVGGDGRGKGENGKNRFKL